MKLAKRTTKTKTRKSTHPPADPTLPRKEARQERSRATVAAILEATERVLVKVGYERTTTNRIADVAGVNIASLYQYFPTKEALVAALIDRHFRAVLDRMGEAVATKGAQSGADLARALVHSYFDLFREKPELHSVLYGAARHVSRHVALEEARREVVGRVVQLFDFVGEEAKVLDRTFAAFVVVHAVESIAVASFTERRDDLRSGLAAREAADLVARYLFSGNTA